MVCVWPAQAAVQLVVAQMLMFAQVAQLAAFYLKVLA